MSCERFGTAIAAHAAGAAIDPAAARHLSGCEACRRRLETQARALAELDAELGRSLSITASPDFATRVARAAREARSAPAQRWVPAPAWAGLGVAAAIVLAVWISRPPVTDSPRVADASRTAAGPARPEDVRLRAEATQTQEKLAQTQRRLTPPRAATTPDCVASGFSRKAAAQACARGTQLPSSEPPVIVEPERALAIARLRELMTEGRLNEKQLPPPVTPEAALAELTIAPLEVAEIRVPDVEIVGRPPAAPQRQ
jgi:hypothetical protein